MIRKRFFPAVLAALTITAAPALAEQPLSRTEPEHLGPVPPGGRNLPLSPPVVEFPMRPQMVVLDSTQNWRKVGRIDKGLSDACANRRFIERFNLQFRAVFEKKDVLGVAFGNGANLYDADRRADKDKVYLFRNGDSTGCVVIVLTREEVKAANDANTKAPPTGKSASTAASAKTSAKK